MTKTTKFKRIESILPHLLQLRKEGRQENFNMDSFIKALPTPGNRIRNYEIAYVERLRENGPKCNTAACLAGEYFIQFAPNGVSTQIGKGSIGYGRIATFTKAYLNLSEREADHMFAGMWASGRPNRRMLSDITLNEAIAYIRKVVREKNVMVTLSRKIK